MSGYSQRMSDLQARRQLMNRGGLFDRESHQARYQDTLRRKAASDQQYVDVKAREQAQLRDIASKFGLQSNDIAGRYGQMRLGASLDEQRAASNHGRSMQGMDREQGYRAAEALKGREHSKALMGLESQFREQAAGNDFGRDLTKMGVQQGYGKENAEIAFQNQQARDAAMHGYGQEDAFLQHGLGMDRLGQEQGFEQKMAKEKFMQLLKGNKQQHGFNREMQGDKFGYEQQLQGDRFGHDRQMLGDRFGYDQQLQGDRHANDLERLDAMDQDYRNRDETQRGWQLDDRSFGVEQQQQLLRQQQSQMVDQLSAKFGGYADRFKDHVGPKVQELQNKLDVFNKGVEEGHISPEQAAEQKAKLLPQFQQFDNPRNYHEYVQGDFPVVGGYKWEVKKDANGNYERVNPIIADPAEVVRNKTYTDPTTNKVYVIGGRPGNETPQLLEPEQPPENIADNPAIQYANERQYSDPLLGSVRQPTAQERANDIRYGQLDQMLQRAILSRDDETAALIQQQMAPIDQARELRRQQDREAQLAAEQEPEGEEKQGLFGQVVEWATGGGDNQQQPAQQQPVQQQAPTPVRRPGTAGGGHHGRRQRMKAPQQAQPQSDPRVRMQEIEASSGGDPSNMTPQQIAEYQQLLLLMQQ